MLKWIYPSEPGGYLQWGDIDINSGRVQKVELGVRGDAHEQLMNLTLGHDARLQSFLGSAHTSALLRGGTRRGRGRARDARPDLAFAMHEGSLISHELIPRQTSNESVAREVGRLIPQVCKETRDGAMFAFRRWLVVERKPAL